MQQVVKPISILEAIILGSWVFLCLVLFLALPISDETALVWVAKLLATVVGIIGGIFALLGKSPWRLLSVIAAIMLILIFGYRVLDIVRSNISTWHMGILEAFITLFKDSGRISITLLNQRGLGPAMMYVYDWAVMPTIQIAILVVLYRRNHENKLPGSS